MNSSIEAGDRVEFTGRRGMVTGVVARLRMKNSRRANSLAAMHDIQLPTSLTSSQVAEVVPDDGQGTWTVPMRMLKLLSKGGKGDASRASTVVQNMRAQYSDNLRQRASMRRQAADASGLYNLKPGDPVSVKFKNGPRTMYFVKHSASGRVLLRYDKDPESHERWIPAQFVTKA